MSNESQREALSALVDGELPDAEASRLLDAMRDDPELREQWRRHHRLSALLSDHQELAGDGGILADRIRDALDREPVVLTPIATRRKVSGRPASWPAGRRLALAACVVLAAVVVALGLTADRVSAPSPETVAGVAAPAERVPVTVASRTASPSSEEIARLTWNDARPGVEARLNAYLLNHNEYLSDGVRGMLPYARVVGYDARN